MNLRFAALLLAVLLILTGCGTSDIPDPASNESNGTEDVIDIPLPEDFYHIPFSPNDQGLYEVVLPVSLLGGSSADKVVENFENADAVGQNGQVTNIWANPDGTVTYVMNEEQYRYYKYRMYTNLQSKFNDSIVSVEYEDSERLTSIIVTVNKEEYFDVGLQRIWVNLYGALYAGYYQVLCGVSPEEWHTVITVKDDETGELISQWKFPFDNMYKTFNWLAPQTPPTDSGGETSAEGKDTQEVPE